MSLKLLTKINGNQKGKFHEWLKTQTEAVRIAWYPSAGIDFRPLMFLHPSSTRLVAGEPDFPNIFIYTDYFPWKESTFLDTTTIYQDENTTIIAEDIEKLPALQLPLHPEIVHFPEGSHATNKAVFMKVKIESKQLGTIVYPVLYVFSENEAFFTDVLMENKAQITHIIQIRYGGGMGGGGYSRGTWIQHILCLLNTKELIACNHDLGVGINNPGPGDHFFLEQNPLLPQDPIQNLQPIRTTPSETWSGYGDVIWYLVDC